MTLNTHFTRQSFSLFLAVALLSCVSLFWSPVSQAADCTSMGGTAIDGCIAPVIKWGDGFGHVVGDKTTAAWANFYFARQNGKCPDCDYGIQTAPITYTNWTAWNCSGSPPTATDSSYTTYDSYSGTDRTSFSVHIYGYKKQTVCGAVRDVYVQDTIGQLVIVKPQCAENTTLAHDLPTEKLNEPFGYVCKPFTNITSVIGSCDSQSPGGLCSSKNPVRLGSREKIGTVVDIATTGPRPIVWSRNYSSLRGGQWHFAGQHKGMTVNTASDGTKRIVANRADSQYVFYKSTNAPNSSTPHTWASNMATSSQPHIQLVLQDRFASGTRVGFNLVKLNGLTEEYDLNGVLLRDRDQQGYVHHYTRDGFGRVSAIEDDFGHKIEILYAANQGYVATTINYDTDDGSGGVVGQTYTAYGTADGADSIALMRNIIGVVASVNGDTASERLVEYTWSANVGSTATKTYNLTSVTDPDGLVTTYGYGETVLGVAQKSNMWTGITDGESRRLRTYNYGGGTSVNVDSEWRGGSAAGTGAKQTMTFGSSYVDDARGNRTTFTYDSTSKKIKTFTTQCWWCAGELSDSKSIVYDTAGNPTTITDFNNVVDKRTYDSSNRLLTQTQAFGTGLARTLTLTYTGSEKDPTTVVEPTLVGGTAHTRTTTFTRNGSGQVTSVVVSTSSGEASRTTLYDYDGDGLLTSSEDPSGQVTGYTYNAAGQVTSVIDAVGTALERTTDVDSYSISGQPTSITFPNGTVLTATWSDAGRLLSTTVSGRGTTSYAYDDAGLLLSTTNPDGTSEHVTYSASGIPDTVIRKNSSNEVVATTTLTRDIMNEVTGVVITNSASQTVLSKTRTLSTINREATSIGSQSQTTTRSYNGVGQETVTAEPLSRTTSRVIDALGRLTQITDPGTGVSALSYDVQDNLLEAEDARGVSTTYTYNGFGDVLTLVSPDRGTWTRSYDSAGRLTSLTDPRSVAQEFSYDDLGRVDEIVFDDTGVSGSPTGFDSGTITHTLTYDSCTNGIGKLCSVTDSTGTRSWSYDMAGRTTAVARSDTPTGTTITTSYGYDSIGRVTSITYPSGKVLTAAYGVTGQIDELTYDSQVVVEDVSWNALGMLSEFTWGGAGLNGSGQTFSYDTDGQPEEIASSFTVSDYTVDAAGRITAIDDTDPNYDQDLTYSAMDRVSTHSVAGWSDTLTYAYDLTGNRTSKTDGSNSGQATAIQSTSNRLTSIAPIVSGTSGSSASVSYDAMGNIIEVSTGQDLLYDATGRLTEWQDGSVVTKFAYDAAGQRVRRQVVSGAQAGTILEAYDLGGRLIGVYAPNGSGGFTVVEELVNLDGFRAVATVRPDPTAGMTSPIVYPIVSDHLQAPRAILSPSTGLPVWTWHATEVFGSQLPDMDPNSYGTFVYDGRFPGQRFDQSTGLLHNGFRVYSAQLGRYLQSDPLGLEAGWNTYAYVGGNPMGNVDPWGLDVIQDAFDYWQPSALNQGFVDGVAGFGDSNSFGFSEWARDKMDGGYVNKCSDAYKRSHFAGSVYGLAIPIGRLAYIAKVSSVPRLTKTAEEAYGMRNTWKAYFRGYFQPIIEKLRPEPSLAKIVKEKGELQALLGAGRTNMSWDLGILGISGVAVGYKIQKDLGDSNECACR